MSRGGRDALADHGRPAQHGGRAVLQVPEGAHHLAADHHQGHALAPAPRPLLQEDVGTRSEEAREDPLGLRPVEGHQRLENALPSGVTRRSEGLSTTWKT